MGSNGTKSMLIGAISVVLRIKMIPSRLAKESDALFVVIEEIFEEVFDLHNPCLRIASAFTRLQRKLYPLQDVEKRLSQFRRWHLVG